MPSRRTAVEKIRGALSPRSRHGSACHSGALTSATLRFLRLGEKGSLPATLRTKAMSKPLQKFVTRWRRRRPLVSFLLKEGNGTKLQLQENNEGTWRHVWRVGPAITTPVRSSFGAGRCSLEDEEDLFGDGEILISESSSLEAMLILEHVSGVKHAVSYRDISFHCVIFEDATKFKICRFGIADLTTDEHAFYSTFVVVTESEAAEICMLTSGQDNPKWHRERMLRNY